MLTRNMDFEEMVTAAESLQREAGIPEALLSFRRQRASLRNVMGAGSLEDIAGVYTDPEQMKLPWWQRSGATLPPETLRRRVLELRGEVPMEGLTEGAAIPAAAAMVAGGEGTSPAGAAAAEVQQKQLEALQEIANEVRRRPARNPEGGE